MMERRRFIGAVACALLATGSAARAQPKQRVRQIAFLSPGEPYPPEQVREFWAPARELGWIEGQNLLVHYRYASGRLELLPSLAEELVRLKPEIIVTQGSDATLAAKAATSSIPIIFQSSGDPVGLGLVASLARPGGNITGLSVVSQGIDAKRLSLLRELVPGAQRVGELINPGNAFVRKSQLEYEQAYRSLGLSPIFVDVTAAGELENAVQDIARRGAQALVVRSDVLFYVNRDAIMRAALKHSLPTLVGGRPYLEAGALLSYTPDLMEQNRRLFGLLDKVLRGAKPADLPVEQPSKFVLEINLKTAKALGVSVPQPLLLRADEVIQ